MKNAYLFLVATIASMQMYSQSDCAKAQGHIQYAFTNANVAYQAKKLDDLKFHSKKTLESFENVKLALSTCNCDGVAVKTQDGIDNLMKVQTSDRLELGQFFLINARNLAQEIIEQFDRCTMMGREEQELAQIEYERNKLQQEQLDLKRKQLELEQKMMEKNQKENLLKKEQLIKDIRATIANNAKTYNEVLKACDCSTVESSETVVDISDLASKSIDEIRKHFIESMRSMTAKYLQKLSLCNLQTQQ